MNPANPQSLPDKHPAVNPLPDQERRKLLKRLGAAAVAVPTATILHDATKNIVLAY